MRATNWPIYERKSGLILGFHGTDKDTADKVISSDNYHLRMSNKSNEWLGDGIYFWQDSPERAMQWAKEKDFKNPTVIGAVIDLGKCLDLFDRNNIKMVKFAHEVLQIQNKQAGTPMPKNVGKCSDLKSRKLDCAVINLILNIASEYQGPDGKNITYDSVRAPFFEDGPVYENSGFYNNSHIQISIRNPDCIKGYFFARTK